MSTNTTIILGAGIISLSTAHYLSLPPSQTPASTIHLIDPSPALFSSASGRAAGFLASDWFGPATLPLGALSFRLHKELAEEYGGATRWGYSESTGTSLAQGVSRRGDEWLRDGGSRGDLARGFEGANNGGGVGKREEEWWGKGRAPRWLAGGEGASVISEVGTAAQVDPLRLCKFLLGEALERGVRLHHPAKAVSVATDMRGELASVRVVEEDGSEVDIPCTRLIIAAGAWTPIVFSTLFPSSTLKVPITSLAGHSLVVKSPRWTTTHEATDGCHAVFSSNAAGFSPEIFSRVGGEIYVSGLNSTEIPLPKVATEAVPQEEAMDVLKGAAAKMLGVPGAEDDLEIVREGLCFRPVTERGPPIVSRVEDGLLGNVKTRPGAEGGVFIAAGHGPWGISQSLGTGKVMAEMVQGLPTSADVSGLAL